MSVHYCPIEPDDWSNGNLDEGNCPDCDGMGEYENDKGATFTCKRCDGTGFVQQDEPSFDDVL